MGSQRGIVTVLGPVSQVILRELPSSSSPFLEAPAPFWVEPISGNLRLTASPPYGKRQNRTRGSRWAIRAKWEKIRQGLLNGPYPIPSTDYRRHPRIKHSSLPRYRYRRLRTARVLYNVITHSKLPFFSRIEIPPPACQLQPSAGTLRTPY
ncbi:unnamed protein product [Tuber aestivum]|uniref:Uncharacterized protein n=1 Tax=Tuber aestivum TaxID=59557 RepID=A0A292PZ17_9PEZI|nr:unnamed protein product [Tuber aestivum]